jgi:uncharacterized protein YkwD
VARARLQAAATSSALAVAICAALAAGVTAAAATPRHGRHCAHRSSYSQGSGPAGSGHGCARPRSRFHRRPGSAACRGTTLRPSAGNVQAIRSAVFCLVNRERALHGEPPLRPNLRLRHAAQEHTDSMARGAYFEHGGPGGATPLARMRAVGYISNSVRAYEVGENIGWGTLWLSTPRAIVASWMASPGHRANILERRFRDTAIGVSAQLPRSFDRGEPGAIYTEDFGVVHGR